VIEAALTYARAGLRVHPVRADKKPYTKWGTDATCAEHMIHAYWGRWPDALVAVCTGNGLVVVDVDPRHGGEWDDELGRTLTATTPGGGWHHWFGTTERIGNAVGILPGVDVRGERGYVLAPGNPGYEWVDPDRPMLPLPAAIPELMAVRKQAERNGPGFEPAEPGSIREGQRHDYMVRFAGWAIRAFELEHHHELGALCLEEYHRACSPADAPDENILRIARSILQRDRRSA
jgi:putative DNA primase/helicase